MISPGMDDNLSTPFYKLLVISIDNWSPLEFQYHKSPYSANHRSSVKNTIMPYVISAKKFSSPMLEKERRNCRVKHML